MPVLVVVGVDGSADDPAPHATALLIGLRVAWRADEGRRVRQEGGIDRVDREMNALTDDPSKREKTARADCPLRRSQRS